MTQTRRRDASDVIERRLRIHDKIMQTLIEKGWVSQQDFISREKASALAYAVLQTLEQYSFVAPTRVAERVAQDTIKKLQDALDTKLDGDDLVNFARARAERLAAIERIVNDGQ